MATNSERKAIQEGDRDRQDRGGAPPTSTEGTTFAREGPTPPQIDTGDSVDEMNKAAEAALRRNIAPEPQHE